MTRSTLSSGNRTEVVKPSLRLEYLASIAFPSGTVRVATGDRDVTFNGFTYVANAKFIGFAGIAEVPDLKARRVTLSMSGLDPALVSAVMNDKYHYAQINLYLALFDENWQLVTTPHQIGVTLFMSSATLVLGDQNGQLSISSETLEVFNRRNSVVLATGESQKRRYADDTGMDKVRLVMEQEIAWANSHLMGGTNWGVAWTPFNTGIMAGGTGGAGGY